MIKKISFRMNFEQLFLAVEQAIIEKDCETLDAIYEVAEVKYTYLITRISNTYRLERRVETLQTICDRWITIFKWGFDPMLGDKIIKHGKEKNYE